MRKWFSRFYYNLTYKICGVDVGPLMIRFGGKWRYIDAYSQVWQITPTMDPHMPLTITLIERP